MTVENKGIRCRAIEKGYYGGTTVEIGTIVIYTGMMKPDKDGNPMVLPLWLVREDLPEDVVKEQEKMQKEKMDRQSHLDYNNPPALETQGKTLPKTVVPQAQTAVPQTQAPPAQDEITPGMTQDLPEQTQVKERGEEAVQAQKDAATAAQNFQNLL